MVWSRLARRWVLGWVLLAAAGAARAASPAWLVQLENAVADDPRQVFAAAQAERARAPTEAARAELESRMMVAAIELEQQEVLAATLPLAQARLASAGGPAERWCIAATVEPALLWRKGEFDAAQAAMKKALARARDAGEDWCNARMAQAQGRLLVSAGRQGDAAAPMQQAYDYFLRQDERVSAASILSDLGWLASRAGPRASLGDAIEKMNAALALLPSPMPRHMGSSLHHNVGGALLEAGRSAEARPHLETAMQLASAQGNETDAAFVGRLLARLDLLEKRPADALRQATLAHQAFERAGIDDMVCQAANIMADALLQLGRPADALATLQDNDALRRRAQAPDVDVAHWRLALSAQARLGHLQAAQEAADAFAAALEHREELIRQKALAEANAQFDVERRDAENRRLREQQAGDASRQFWLGLSLLLACVLTGLLGWLALRQHRDRLRLRMLAEVDELTGLPNRRAVQEALRQDMLRARTRGEPFCLAICDIDHFKRVNDRFGHDVGDEALRCFARAGRSALRSGDTLGRFGGEEFVILLRGSTAAAAPAFERLIGALRQTPVPGMPEDERLSFSMGVAAWRPELSEAALIQAADQALYRAKHAGRSRVEIAAEGA